MFNQNELKQLEKAIGQAELGHHGEILPVIVNTSDNYPASHWRMGVFFLFLASALALYCDFPIIYAELIGFILGYGLAYIPLLKRLITGHEEMSLEVHQRATQAFFNHKVYSTKDGTGILIFISLLEKRIEVLADAKLKLVDNKVWQDMVKNLGNEFHQHKEVDGLIKTIKTCGDLLRDHAPDNSPRTNQLENKVIFIKD